MSWLATWWVWVAGALVFAILETLAPVFVFIGLGAGALAVGGLLFLEVGLGQSTPMTLVAFAAISLVATLLLRFLLGTRRDEVTTFTDDINK
ncbi:MAG: hypothetical protein ABJQ34_14005 [Paracoccaceae bacterium]